MDISQVRSDLLDEQASLDELVAPLSAAQWKLSTPSPGWSIADQVAHLTYFDRTAALAIADPDSFLDTVATHMDAVASANTAGDADSHTLASYRQLSADQLLESWRAGRNELAATSATLGNDDRVSWYGPSMGSKSFLTARLMEAWAHGQDIVDALGAERPATDRLQHIARMGFNTRGWSYANRGQDPSLVDVRVVLSAPSGNAWAYGAESASESITGSAEDFCLVVTQRRHVDNTGLQVDGAAAREWMHLAQAFAGGATDGPRRS